MRSQWSSGSVLDCSACARSWDRIALWAVVFIVRTRPTMIYSIGHRGQWLKWLCEAGAGGLT